MKTNSEAFPYPVLTSEVGKDRDYRNMGYVCMMEPSFEDKHVQVSFNHEVRKICDDKSEISYTKEFISHFTADRVSYVIDLHSPEVYFRKSIWTEQSGTISFDPIEHYGKITLTPILAVTQGEDIIYKSEFLNKEYKNAAFNIEEGDLTAIGEATNFFVSYNKIDIGDIVKVRVLKDYPDTTYNIDLGQSYIYLDMNVKHQQKIAELCSDTTTRKNIAMAYYKDALVHALMEMSKKGDDEVQEGHWKMVLDKLIVEMNVDLFNGEQTFNDLNKIAQRILAKLGVGLVVNSKVEQ